MHIICDVSQSPDGDTTERMQSLQQHSSWLIGLNHHKVVSSLFVPHIRWATNPLMGRLLHVTPVYSDLVLKQRVSL